MATDAELSLYPSSTDDGKAIPLDVIMPKELLFSTVPAGADIGIVIPADFFLVSIMSSVDVMIDLSNEDAYPLASGVYPEGIFIAAGITYTMRLPSTGAAKVIPVVTGNEAGWISIQNFQKWAGLGLRRQLNIRG